MWNDNVLILRSERSESLEGCLVAPLSALCGFPKRLEVTLDQRFFLGARPALEFSLYSDGVGDPVERFMEDELDRSPVPGVAAMGSGVVFRDPRFK